MRLAVESCIKEAISRYLADQKAPRVGFGEDRTFSDVVNAHNMADRYNWLLEALKDLHILVNAVSDEDTVGACLSDDAALRAIRSAGVMGFSCIDRRWT